MENAFFEEDYRIMRRQLVEARDATRDQMVNTLGSHAALTMLTIDLVLGWEEPRFRRGVDGRAQYTANLPIEANEPTRGTVPHLTRHDVAFNIVVPRMQVDLGFRVNVYRLSPVVYRPWFWQASFESGAGIWRGNDVDLGAAICRAALKAALHWREAHPDQWAPMSLDIKMLEPLDT